MLPHLIGKLVTVLSVLLLSLNGYILFESQGELIPQALSEKYAFWLGLMGVLTIAFIFFFEENWTSTKPHKEGVVEHQKEAIHSSTHYAGRDILTRTHIQQECARLRTINSFPEVKPFLFDKVRLLSFHERSTGQREWLCFNGELGELTVNLDFSGCINYQFENDMAKTTKTIPPFKCERLASIRIEDLYKGSGFSMRSSGSLGPLSQEHLLGERKQIEQEYQTFMDQMGQLASNLTEEAIRRRCREANVKFCDTRFRANQDSICGSFDQNPYPVIHWQRPDSFMEDDFALFDGVSPMDINQGQLGDCWFLCALSAVAEHPGMVRRLFRTTKRNEEGVYQLNILKAGRPVVVTLDDYIPCGINGPIFSKNHNQELWVMLLEKAYAKLHGNYCKLRAGTAQEALTDLTGYPVQHFDFKDYSSPAAVSLLWEQAKMWGQADYIMCAGTPGVDCYSERGLCTGSTGGLVPGHAYSVLDTRAVFDSRTGRVHHLVKLRNPWGNFEWDGEWSDESPLWTEELLQAMDFSPNPTDGIFIMSFEDVLEYFDGITVCYQHTPTGHPWRSSRAEGQLSLDIESKEVSFSNALTLDIKAECECWFVIHQANQRFEGAKDYVDLGLAVLHADGALAHVSDIMIQPANWSHVVLSPGRYTVLPLSTATQINKFCDRETTDHYQVAVFSDHIVRLKKQAWDADLYTRTMSTIAHKGSISEMPHGIKLLSLSTPSSPIYSYAAYLPATERGCREVTMIVTDATNLTSHRRLKTYSATLMPGDTKLFHHLGPIDTSAGTNVKMSLRVGSHY